MADDPNLQIPSFAAHATRGLIRNQSTRRRLMIALLIAALVMILAGSSFFAPFISPKAHAIRFLFYWIICGWLTLTVLLLALFDILVIRRDGRAARKSMQGDLNER